MIEMNSSEERSRRIIEPELTPADVDIEYSLRPKHLNEYIGQDKVKKT